MKIDLHTHSYYSKDGSSSPEKMVKRAAQIGLDGIAITDHNTIKAWKEAKKAAKKYEISLILGEEVKTRKNGKFFADILALFIKKEVKSREPKLVIEEIKKQGGIVIIPHPFHWVVPFKGDLEKYKGLVDGIEVLNARMPSKKTDEKAIEFAEKNNMATIGVSDAHYWKNVGDAYTLAKNSKNLEEFKMAILNKKTKAFGKKSSLVSAGTTLLSKYKIIGKPPKK